MNAADATHSSENLRKFLPLIWPPLAPVLGYILPPPSWCSLLSSPTWGATTVTVWRPSVEETTDRSLRFLPDAEKKLASSWAPQARSRSLCLCCARSYAFLLRLLTQSIFFLLLLLLNGLRQLLKIQTSLVKIHATSSQKAPTAGRLGRISSVKTVRFWCKILFRSSRIVEGIMKRLFWKSVEERINMSASVLHFRHVFCFPLLCITLLPLSSL